MKKLTRMNTPSLMLTRHHVQTAKTLVQAFATKPASTSDANPFPFRDLLSQAGKKVFRPGGSKATEKLHSWATLFLDSNSHVVEFAAGPGSGMDLVQRQGCNLLITNPDAERLQIASQLVHERGLTNKVLLKKIDLANLNFATDEKFDAAIVEAVLTKYPHDQKSMILQDLLKITDQILLYEICIRGCDLDDSPCSEEVKSQVGSVLQTGYEPMTTNGWIRLLDEVGLSIKNMETGPIRLIKPLNILKDEGPVRAAKFAWNVATDANFRNRFVSTWDVFQSNENKLGYVIAHAVKNSS